MRSPDRLAAFGILFKNPTTGRTFVPAVEPYTSGTI